MKSQRLLGIILRLQARSPRSARELAEQLEVSERTIYRDIDSLSAAGVPVFTIRGSQGGVGLVDGYRQAIAQLMEQDIRALFAGGADPLADLGFGEQLQSARDKLFGALSATQRAHAIKVRERIRIEQRAWGAQAPPLTVLSTLRLALWEDRSVAITYRNQTGQVAPRVVNPLGIVFKGGIWYCVAQHGERISSFRADRMLTIEVLPLKFLRPKDFQLDAFWAESQARYESKASPCLVRVRGARRDLEQLAVFWPTRIEIAENAANGTADIEFPLQGQAVHELLAWSSLVEVLSPATVRADIVARLQAALGRYRDRDATATAPPTTDPGN